MEKFEVELVSVSASNPSFYTNIQMALVNGYFMQVAHRAGERGRYKTVKDDQVRTGKKAGKSFLTRPLYSPSLYIHPVALTPRLSGWSSMSLC
jgi:hypothetical protein